MFLFSEQINFNKLSNYKEKINFYKDLSRAISKFDNVDYIKMAKALDSFSTNKEYEKHVIEVIKKLRNEIKK